ncbi:glucosaminidase domain-containing protein [Sulfurimonas sp.]|nr:glucosaminidase domain-containing protein [Sulfurimonas sp.]
MLTNKYRLPAKVASLLLLSDLNVFSDQSSFRKYLHVEKFYTEITPCVIDVSLKHNIPPAAVMAIAGLESGYGSGYVAQITGNILSLGAFKGDRELPRLYLPYSKSIRKVIYDTKDISSFKEDDLVWKKRPKSFKRDYRPTPYAGTNQNLELLKYDKQLREEAISHCINDFATRCIVSSSKVKVFREARKWLDKEVTDKDYPILFSEEINKKFIDMIGGKKHSFNFRDTWPKKAKLIMNKVGLVKLTKDIYINKMNFKKAWDNK